MNINEDQLYENSSDEERLRKLPEKEREEILFQRHQQIEKLNEKREMEKRLRETQKIVQNGAEKEEETDKFTYDEFSKLIIKREELIKCVYKPLFENCKGLWIRIKFGSHYAIREIQGIENGDIYSFVMKDNRKGRTNRYLKLVESKNRIKSYPINFVGNSELQHIEFDYFKRKQPEFDMKKVTLKTNRFRQNNTRKPSREELRSMSEEKSKFIRPAHVNIWEKIRLIGQRDDAFKKGDQKKYEELQNKIDQIDEQDRNPDEEKEKEIWKKLNKKNRQINYEKAIAAAEQREKNSDKYITTKRRKT